MLTVLCITVVMTTAFNIALFVVVGRAFVNHLKRKPALAATLLEIPTASEAVNREKVPEAKQVPTPEKPAGPPVHKPHAKPRGPKNEADDVTFNCPRCRRQVRAARAMSGKKARCPACDKFLIVPTGCRPDDFRRWFGGPSPN